MGIVSSLQRSWSPKVQARSFNQLIDMLTDGMKSSSGITVSSTTALSVPAVYSCIRVLSETLSQLPLIVYRRRADGGKERATDDPAYKLLHDQPNSWQTSTEFRDLMMMYALLSGNAIAEIKTYGRDVELWPLHPSRVSIERSESGKLAYMVSESYRSPRRLLQEEVFHVRGPSLDGIVGMTPIAFAKDTIGTALATQKHNATTWKNSAKPAIVLQTDQTLPPNAADRMREGWTKMYGGSENAGKTAVLEAGLKVHELTLNHSDLQFIEQEKFNVEEIARLFRVPLHMIGDLEHATFSNIEHQQLEFVSHTMGPWFVRWEQAIQRDLLQSDDLFAEFLVEGLLRGDVAARTTHYREMFNIGVYSVDEIRGMENRNPVGDEAGGGKRFVNAAMVDLTLAGQLPEPATEQKQDDPQAEDKTTEQQKQAARSLWDAECGKLRRWLADEIVRCAKEPSKFIPKMESFCESHEARTAASLLAAENVCRACGVDVRADTYAKEQRAAVWTKILAVSDASVSELAGRASLLAEELRK